MDIRANLGRIITISLGCVLAIGLGGCSRGSDHGPGTASCVAQEFTVEPASVSAGGTLTFHGRYYVNGCGDVVDHGTDASSPVPLSRVPLVMTTVTGETQTVARLDARVPTGDIGYSFILPAYASPGSLTFTLGDAEPVRVEVTS